MIPFPTIEVAMFRRLDEAWRLYRIRRKPIVVSGGHVNPFTPAANENQIARDYLIGWGVPPTDVLGEDRSRDTFESALESKNSPHKDGAAISGHLNRAMPRSMLAFRPSAGTDPAPGIFLWAAN
jgi:hypothetical protein